MSEQFAHDSPTAQDLSGNRGQLIRGRYYLERLIAAGGMGSVWLARDRRVGDYVAIKLLSRRLLHSAEARGRFVREAIAAGKLRSRFVVRVYDAGETADDVPFLVMELLSGETLEQRLQREHHLPASDVVRLGVQVARALTHAHRQGIVHRDLKPGNVFLHCVPPFASDLAVAKVLDFGIAKFSEAPNSARISNVGTVLGTPQYMSPEQVRGLAEIDHRSDLYALGMLVYASLTGTVAFESNNIGDLAYKICTHELPAIDARALGIPSTVDAWFRRACAREPEQRFQSAQELASFLHVALGCEGPLDQHLECGVRSVNSDRPGPLAFEFERPSELPTLRFVPPLDD